MTSQVFGQDFCASVNTQNDAVQLTETEWNNVETHVATTPYYVFSLERECALALIKTGLKTRPVRYGWGTQAGMLCIVDGERRRQLKGDQRREAYQESLGCLQEFYDLARQRLRASPEDAEVIFDVEALEQHLAEAAIEGGEMNLAKSLATSLLGRISDQVPWTWTSGNIVHKANILWGRVALREDKLDEAKQYLLRAGKTPGSPQLNSYGPDFHLARELLEEGEVGAVLEYLGLVRVFWNNAPALQILEQSEQEIRAGKIPTGLKWH